MITAAIVSCLLAGAGASCAAPHMLPAHVEAFERCGGILLVAGLALLGASLPA